jgi:hypothetical protein
MRVIQVRDSDGASVFINLDQVCAAQVMGDEFWIMLADGNRYRIAGEHIQAVKKWLGIFE